MGRAVYPYKGEPREEAHVGPQKGLEVLWAGNS